MLFAGIDVGTSGVRIVIADEDGRIVSQQAKRLAPQTRALPPGWAEQDPESWWTTLQAVLRSGAAELSSKGYAPDDIEALSVTSTSGTVLPLDRANRVLHPALMHNDSRAVDEAALANHAGCELTKALGFRFNSSFALAKLLWIKRNRPAIYDRTTRFLHAADYLLGCLSGDFAHSDRSNAFKTGYDQLNLCWPPFIEEALGISLALLPDVGATGDVVAQVSPDAARATGLSPTTKIALGATDSTAGLFASGAARPGDASTALGTSLAVKAVADHLVKDPQGRLYCQVHPEGYWLPGGASNGGGRAVQEAFRDEDLEALDAKADARVPNDVLLYPLAQRGERFPFVKADAEGFAEGAPRNRQELFTAHLEAVGFVERWCYETIEELGVPVGNIVYVSGGGSRGRNWLRIRASILNRQLAHTGTSEAAMGACLFAASKTRFNSLSGAVGAMVRKVGSVDPESGWLNYYEEKYRRFRDACARHGLS